MAKASNKRVAWVWSNPQRQWVQQSVGKSRSAGSIDLELSGTRHQTWEGFGGCFNEMGWHYLCKLQPRQQQAVIKDLFDTKDGCRFNVCRLPVGANDYAMEWYSHDEHDGDFAMREFSVERDRRYLIPYIRSALKHRPDMKLFASPWSPPTWLKFPKAYNYGTLIWDKRHLDALALYFVKFVQAYAAAGITIHQIHPQNEPVADQKFPSCLWSGPQMRDFIRDHLAPAFRRHGLSTEIWLGTINSDDYNGFALAALSDPKARAFISGVGYQWAGKHAIQRTHESFPNVRLMQTENECGDGRNTWGYAHYVFDLMRHYMSHGVNAYVYWNMILPPGGKSTWGWPQNAMITVDADAGRVTYNPEFYVMKHFSRFVEPGATRVGLKGPWTGNAVAFENPGGQVVILAANGFEQKRTLSLGANGQSIRCELMPQSLNTLIVG